MSHSLDAKTDEDLTNWATLFEAYRIRGDMIRHLTAKLARLEQAVNVKPLTRVQHSHYLYLAKYYAEHGYAPSMEEMAQHFGYLSSATVHEALVRLERKGWLARDEHTSRGIRLLVEVVNNSALSSKEEA